MTWAERVADRSPSVQRTRVRSVEQARAIVAAARRLVSSGAGGFTTQELAREADIALQTFYRYFPGKDDLLLAVIEEWISEGAQMMVVRGATLDGPLERLRLFVTGPLEALIDEPSVQVARFITAEHYRLHQLYPDELAEATLPFTRLFSAEITAAADAGLLHPKDVEHDAWLLTQLSMAVFHHYAYATHREPLETVADRLWAFCLVGLGAGSH